MADIFISEEANIVVLTSLVELGVPAGDLKHLNCVDNTELSGS